MAELLSRRLLPAELLAAELRQGQAALLPTDTLPALACVPSHAAQIWQLKRRPPDKPLILMAADLEALVPWLGGTWLPEWLEMASLGWPGALTLVLPARGDRVNLLHPGGQSLGLRIPACCQARELLGLSGPLATTSANPSGQPPARSALEAAAAFPQLPLLGPLPWPEPSGQASTVLRWDGSAGWTVLRSGAFLPPAPISP